jgi:hypothetical protein
MTVAAAPVGEKKALENAKTLKPRLYVKERKWR